MYNIHRLVIMGVSSMSHGSLGERIALTRFSSGMTLQQLSQRTGLNAGYLSQLEQGHRGNPTVDTVVKLARALGAPVSYLMGDMTPTETAAQIGIEVFRQEICDHFAEYVSALTPQEKDRWKFAEVEKLFGLIVKFLCDRFPHEFSRVTIACALGMSVQGLIGILDEGHQVSPMAIQSLARLTGIPLYFMATGELATAEEAAASCLLAHQYPKTLRFAAREKIDDEDLIRWTTLGKSRQLRKWD